MPAREPFPSVSKRRAPAARRPGRALDLEVQIATRGAGLPRAAMMRRWARAALARAAGVTVRIVGGPEARRLNRSYRGSDYATNVLSFPYDGRGPAVCGDIVLCAPVIRREAARQGKDLEAHYAHLVVHGLLHLQGYRHDAPRAAKKMETLETGILAKLGYPDPYPG
jgi:probable rRNA maturation factor